MTFTTLGLRVSDLAASRAFWVDLLGFPVAATYEDQLVVALDPLEVLFDATREMPDSAGVELCVRCDAETFAERVRILTEAHAPLVRPAKDYGGPLGLEATFRDPSGHLLVLHVGG